MRNCIFLREGIFTLEVKKVGARKVKYIDDSTYDNTSTALRQHVYKMYPQLDKCKDSHFCRFPFPLDSSTINELGLTQISKKNLPKSLLAAQRYCSAIRENQQNPKPR